MTSNQPEKRSNLKDQPGQPGQPTTKQVGQTGSAHHEMQGGQQHRPGGKPGGETGFAAQAGNERTMKDSDERRDSDEAGKKPGSKGKEGDLSLEDPDNKKSQKNR